MGELNLARFTFPSDKAMAEEMMAGFEWTIKQAFDEAELAQNADYMRVDLKHHLPKQLSRRQRPSARAPPIGHRPSIRGQTELFADAQV